MENENKAAAPETAMEVAPEATAEKSGETIEELRSRLAKADELANNYKIRAEKAEKGNKAYKPETKNSAGLTSKDTIAIIKADIPEEDIDEVLDYAKYKGISVSEALRTDAMRATLGIKAEQRSMANAANTGGGRRGTAKISEAVLLHQASQGFVPDNDEDIARLIRAKSLKRK